MAASRSPKPFVGVRVPPWSPVLGCVQQTFIHLTFNQNRKKSNLFYYVGALCNGSTTDFDSVSLGSIPNAPAKFISRSVSGYATWFGARISWVRVPHARPILPF